MAKEVIVTPEYINSMIDKLQAENPEALVRFVGRALVVIFKNQTDAERSANTVDVNNGIGFTGQDGYSGCLTAKSFIKNKTLADWQVAKWIKKNPKGSARLAKYHRQLNEAAIAKQKMMENNETT